MRWWQQLKHLGHRFIKDRRLTKPLQLAVSNQPGLNSRVPQLTRLELGILHQFHREDVQDMTMHRLDLNELTYVDVPLTKERLTAAFDHLVELGIFEQFKPRHYRHKFSRHDQVIIIYHEARRQNP